jgi:monothiol glutaredoxin
VRPTSTAFKAIQTSPLSRFTPLQIRLLSTETKAAIDKAVASAPVVLFMKGTPETPQCGFSRASIQILGLQGVDPSKFTAFNVLEDQDLRAGMSNISQMGIVESVEASHRTMANGKMLQALRNTQTGQPYRSYT